MREHLGFKFICASSFCSEPGREGGLIPTKTDDVYLLYLSHKPQTQSTNI